MNLKRAFLILMATMILPGYALAQDLSIGITASVDFFDSNADETLTVTFSCNDGNNPNAVAVLGDGDSFRHPNDGMADTFVCTVTATDVNENYYVTYSAGGVTSPLPCEFDAGDLGETNEVSCAIEAYPETATITVTKTWVFPGAGGDEVDTSATIEARAAIGVLDAGVECEDESTTAECVYLSFSGEEDEADVVVNAVVDGVDVTFMEMGTDSAVEVTNGCGTVTVEPGDEVECGFTNTVFFEGIPTLSQYGMAIMVLLMLGVGFVGFRRFV